MAVADVIISRVLDSLISFVAGEIEQQVKLVAGVEDEIKMLTTNLQSIQAVLIDAEHKQLKQKAVQLWLGRLKLISYDIDDVLDEWSTEILKSQIGGDHTVKPRSKVWSFINSFCLCFHEVGFRRDIAVKIRELNGSLDVIAKEKERYGFQQIQGISERVQRVMTTSVVYIQEVKGREHDKNVVMHSLLADSKRNPHVISLVGMGGIGKTTLAKLVYNEDSLKSVFDIRIWVCVSDPFDEMRIAKAILESLEGTTPSLNEMQNIVRDIQKYIEGKRFLLVLDDVWNEDTQKWNQVEHFVKCGLLGRKILVTTRKENVAKKMGCSPRDVIRLGILSDEECWSVFSQVVFLEDNTENNKNFEEIGKKIVLKCKGLPLAVKSIGGLLRFKYSVEEWQTVLDSELWELGDLEEEVFAPLRLSYDDLSSSLKQCFLYCAIFPKDHMMGKRELITMWASQGYLRKTHNKDVMVVGDEHFQHLAMRSFFQDFEFDKWSGSISTFKMHDIVHDFAQSLIVKKEYCSIDVNNLEELKIELNDNKIFHVGFVLEKEALFPRSFCTLEKLHSLVVLPGGGLVTEGSLPDIFNQLTCLRSLTLCCCGVKSVPSNISKLVHLRQLDLSWNQTLQELPETICELCNLETLNVYRCSLKSLPREMGKLVNLKCLYNDWCQLPKEIGKLSGLQRLGWIEVDNYEREALCVGDIKNLKELGGSLVICWRRQVRDVDVRNAEEGELKSKKNLSELGLFFRYEDEEEKEQQNNELIEAVEAPPNLKYLKIYFYKGTKSPSWISSLTFLRKVYLTHWTNCTEFPPLGKLPSLEYLKILKFESIKRVGDEFLGMNENKIAASSTTATAFPKLTELIFEYFNNWEVWDEEDGINKQQKSKGEEEGILRRQIMPCLHSFILRGCPKLKVLPSYIVHNTSLKREIQHCFVLEQLL